MQASNIYDYYKPIDLNPYFIKCKIYLLALSAMALAMGCSNDETTELNKGNAINFSVTAGKLTRAAKATTTDNISEFKVWAFTGGNTYMDGIEVKGNGNNWTYDGTKFWPETEVNFFAVSPMVPEAGTLNVNGTNKELTDYIASGFEDLLYATNKGETKDAHKTKSVNVNFRHALSQIVFKAKLTDNSSIDVEIKSIKVDGVANKATLTWPENTTGSNLITTEEDTETDKWGTWSEPTGTGTTTMAAAANDGTVKLSLNSEKGSKEAEVGIQPLFLMPQTLKPWLTIEGGKAKMTGSARLLINCKITDATSGLQLWPKTGTYDYVAISLDNPKKDPKRVPNAEGKDSKHDKWMQGKKYTYTLIFGEGGGYNPTPDPDPSDPDNPKPVLVPVKFDVTVDVFQNGNEYDLKANNPKP